jgi:subtilase family serine protease
MHFNVKNQGQAAAGALQVRIYLSRDNRVSSDDAVLRVRSFGAVAAGATIANGMTESIPSGTRAGSYYVLLVVDAGGTVGESNEGNNTVVKAITVR